MLIHEHKQKNNDDDGAYKAAHGNFLVRVLCKYISDKCQILTIVK